MFTMSKKRIVLFAGLGSLALLALSLLVLFVLPGLGVRAPAVFTVPQKTSCYNCSGTGNCWPCGGDGETVSGAQCSMCGGSGDCYYCSGKGEI